MPSTLCGIPQGEDLGVGGRVLAQLAFVVALRDDLASDEHDGSDGHVVVVKGERGLAQGDGHGLGVGHPGSVDPGRTRVRAGAPSSGSSSVRGEVTPRREGAGRG